MMVQRILSLEKVLGSTGSAFLLGARGVGKSELSRKFCKTQKHVFSIDLLHSENYERYLKAPELLRREVESFLKNKQGISTVFIDEIQRVPALLNEIHSLMETHRKKVRFLMTGSSARKLKKLDANLLSGRAYSLRLHPLTHREFDIDLNTVLRLGSLPGIVLENEQPELSLRSYVSTYLREEVLQESLVRKVESFAKFLDLSGQLNGEIINASSVGKSAGISTHSVLEYFQILIDTMLGFWLPGWSASVKKQLRTSPKFYLFDLGIVNAIRGELKVELKESSFRYGQLFEGWVIQEIFRMNDYAELDLKMSFWRTNNDMEVDLVLSRGLGQPIAGIKIKSSTRPEEKDVRGLLSFATEYPKAKLFCFCRSPRAYKIGKVHVLPWMDGLKLEFL